MREETTVIPAQAQATVNILEDLFGHALLAAYLHGSAVSGGLRPQSDIDLLAVIDRPMTEALRRSLLAAMLRISGRHPAPSGGPRCIELMLFKQADLAALRFPAAAEFVYGEWLRSGFEAGAIPMPFSDPEITLVLAQARQEARPLRGPVATAVLPEIPAAQVRRATCDALPALLAGLHGDERNVLLTLARMWRTATTGEFTTKDAAAAWALRRLPEPSAKVLAYAREAYLGEVDDDWGKRRAAARQTADCLQQRVTELL